MIDMDRVLDGRPTKGMMMLGLRGVGKTVLLNRLHRMAEEKGFRTAKVEAPEGGVLPQLLAPELRQVLYSPRSKSRRWSKGSPGGFRPAKFRRGVQG
jgi:hypothetical protein